MREFLAALHEYPITSFLVAVYIFSLIAVIKGNGK
jgi:hypothetical protein